MTEFVNAYIWTRFYQKCPHNKSILDFYRTDVVFCIRLPDSTDTKLSAISLFHFPHCYCHHLEILRCHQLSILWSPASPHSINLGDQKGWGQNAKLGPHSAIWRKLGTALQAYALNPCTKFPPNPTSRKVNT